MLRYIGDMEDEPHSASMEPRDIGRTYQIRVLGKLHPGWAHWFNAVQISADHSQSRNPETTLHCTGIDQPMLRGILNKLWDMNLTILAVWTREESPEEARPNPNN